MTTAAESATKLLAQKDFALAETNNIVSILQNKIENHEAIVVALGFKTAILESTQVELTSKVIELSEKNKKVSFLEHQLSEKASEVSKLHTSFIEAKADKGYEYAHKNLRMCIALNFFNVCYCRFCNRCSHANVI